MGFNVAFALTGYDGSTEIAEDEDYAILKAKIKTWGYAEEYGPGIQTVDVKTRQCTPAELGIEYTEDHSQ